MPGRRSVGCAQRARDSGFDSYLARAAVEDAVDLVAEAAANVAGSGGESSVNRLALGAAKGMRAAQMSACATGCAGMRKATVGRPAVTSRAQLAVS